MSFNLRTFKIHIIYFRRIKHEKSPYTELNDSDFNIPLQTKSKIVQTIEASVQEGDTLQAIALRFNCTVRVDPIESSSNKGSWSSFNFMIVFPIDLVAMNLLCSLIPYLILFFF